MPYTLLLIATLMLGGCGRIIVETPKIKVDVDPGTDELKAPPPPVPVPRPRLPKGS